MFRKVDVSRSDFGFVWEEREKGRLTCGAIVAGVESGDQSGDGAAACCAVEGDERLGACHCVC